MKQIFSILIVGLLVIVHASNAEAKLNVGATVQDLEALVKAIGGNEVTTFSIAKGTQDPHQIEAKPSFMVKVRDADLMVSLGLELESAWLVPLINSAHNSKVAIGSKGFLELGSQLDPIDAAKGAVSRAEGDVHPDGNPHFEVDPIRMGKAAVLIAERLGQLDTAHRDQFLKNAETFQKHLEDKTKEWKSRIDKTGIKEFVSYHKTFSYFADRFGLKNTLHLEPKPGIPPTASHILDVIGEMKARKVKLVLIENFFDDSVRSRLESEIPGVKIFKLPVYVGGELNVETTEQLIEKIVQAFEAAK